MTDVAPLGANAIRILLPAFTLAIASTGTPACPTKLEGAQTIESPRHTLAYRTTPARLAVGKPFTVDLVICPKDPQTRVAGIEVDARMPEHRHGMNYKATVTPQADGRYRAEGLMFHMPGRWEFMFDVRDAQGVEHLTHDTTIR